MSKSIAEIYAQYRIPSWLQMHMYRVAAVGATIFDERAAQSGDASERGAVISACLLHDMGNIIKFDFSILAEFFQQEGREYWEGVKAEFIARYGTGTHAATEAIVREIGVSERTFDIVQGVGFGNAERIEATGDMARMIPVYADMRVGPRGVISLQDRLADLRVRYAGRSSFRTDERAVERQERALASIESILFEGIRLRPADLTDASIEAMRKGMESYVVV